ncbi:MAG: hypothetical protein COA94_04705 [Rickettsiales bacterium]|nr:MAG: hypothetical protein COA94_04705 [Rickettsiales bacterium]
MAIGTDATIIVLGTTDVADDTSTSAIVDGVMSVAADITAWTNDDDAPFANFILNWQSAATTLTGNIFLHVRPINIDGANDSPIPTTADPIGRAGVFEIDGAKAINTDHPYLASIDLRPFTMKTSQEFEFYLFNNTGETIAANWDLDVVPLSFNGAA